MNKKEYLSLEEEQELLDRIERGDVEAKWELWTHMQGLILSSVRKYTRNTLIQDSELEQTADIPFHKALATYDRTKGMRFSTWLFWYVGMHFEKTVKILSRTAINFDTSKLFEEESLDQDSRWFEQLAYEDDYYILHDNSDRVSAEIGIHEDEMCETLPDFGDEVTNLVARAIIHDLKANDVIAQFNITMSEYYRARKVIRSYYEERD